MKLTTEQKNNFFWYFLIPSLVLITLTISLSPWFFEMVSTPKGRFFTGINRFSTDYFIYLSYVELGRRGNILAKLLIETVPQFGVFTHTVHTLGGYVFGRILNFSSPASYHITRTIWGLLFLLSVVLFFFKISQSKKITLFSFFLTFFVAGFAKIVSVNPLKLGGHLEWLQEQNIIGRASGPIHYNAGFVFFILSVLWFFFSSKVKFPVRIIVLGGLLNLCLNANPFAYLILGLISGLYFIFSLLFIKKQRGETWSQIFFLFYGFALTLPLLFYNYKFLSGEPWGKYGMSPKFYVVNHLPLPFFESVFSIGPIFFIALIEIILTFRTKRQNRIFIFLVCWLICQFFLFFFGDYLKIHPLRAFSGLYYLPLAYFTALFIGRVFKKNQLIIYLILFLITLPNYYLSYRQQLFAFTDFKNYSLFTFPTTAQGEAFSFMEQNIPAGQGVLALFETSSLIPAFTGCSTDLGMSHTTKTRFYKAEMKVEEAYKYLKANNFSYIYSGYQEKYNGVEFEKYPFLKKIYHNSEVDLYQLQ